MSFDPMATDPGRWGHSLANLAEVLIPLLDAAAPRVVVEVGAYAGDVTRLLLEWAEESTARIWSIDPDPQQALLELAQDRSQLELITATSHDALPTAPRPDAVIVDGDHNYYTVSGELRLIAERGDGAHLPLVICHDVGWPHGRRDSYYSPSLVPEEHRQPIAEGGFVFPGVPGLHSGGLPYRWPALQEGGAGNGVLTAVEDFVARQEDARLAIVPAFFGLAVVWSKSAPWSDAVAQILDPWDRNPVLERLEANRVLHLASWQLEYARAGWCEERSARKDALLHKLLQSKTFGLAIWLSRLRQRGTPAFSKDEVRRLLGD